MLTKYQYSMNAKDKIYETGDGEASRYIYIQFTSDIAYSGKTSNDI